MTQAWRRTAAAVACLAVFLLVASGFSPAQEAIDNARKVLNRVSPHYPSLARTMNIKGSVRVEAVIAPNGTAKSVDIKGGHPVLAQAAVDAVRQWKWEPAAHESRQTIEFKFTPD